MSKGGTEITPPASHQETVVLLRVTGRPGVAWWRTLRLPPPHRWGDDNSYAYVIRAVSSPTVKAAA